MKEMLAQLDSINSQRSFQRWKVTFLERFEQFLDGNAVSLAEDNYQSFTLSMGKTSRLVKRLYGFLQTGELTPPDSETGEGERVTVKARKALTDLHSQIDELMDHLTGMLPASTAEEKELGYTKYHLGAVLIRDGFVEYDRLVTCDEILQHMRWEALQHVADRVLLDQMEYYHDRLQMFCDVMADLGLLAAMVRCRQLLYVEEEEDDESEDEDQSVEQMDLPAPLPVVAATNADADATRITKDPPDAHLTISFQEIPRKPVSTKVFSSLSPSNCRLSKKKAKSPVTSPVQGLYTRSTDDDDSDSEVKSRSNSSEASDRGSQYTETSYFNDQPVWEQKKGENSKAYFDLGTYYHGNPTAFLQGRKLRNKSEEKKDDNAESTQDDVKRDARAEVSKSKNTKDSLEKHSKKHDKREKTEKTPKKEHKREKEHRKEKKEKDAKKKKLKPLPFSYPPPPPNASKASSNDANSDDENRPSFLPSTIGGPQSPKRDAEPKSNQEDVEDLGMESAHGTAIMNHHKKKVEKKMNDGASQWGAILGPTDKKTGRPEIHRRMSVASLDPEEDDGARSILPQTSLLAPKKSTLDAHKDVSDDEEEAITVPLTPSQIKAHQKNGRSFRSLSISDTSNRIPKSKPKDDSNQTPPTDSSTTEEDAGDDKGDTTKPARVQPLEAPEFSSDLGLGSSNPAQHISRQARNHVHHRPHLSKKKDDGVREFSVPRRTSSGLKDYSKYVSGEEDSVATPKNKPGLKDYSKRGGRTANLANTAIGADDDMTKDKQHLLDSDGIVTSNNEKVRKPKKALKISMSTKQPEIKAPLHAAEAPRSPERKERKGRSEKKRKNEKRPVPLTEDEKVLMRKKCYMWYARMGQPDRENMKRRVAALPSHCNIYPEDVDLLPWSGYGTVLSVKAMNELFVGDDAD